MKPLSGAARVKGQFRVEVGPHDVVMGRAQP
jgi:hypothetical protein